MTEQKIELKMIRMSEVQSQEIEWLWYPFIPYGKPTIIQGDPGDGKTTMVLNLAAKLSKGEALDKNMKVTEPVNVIYQTAEDGLADTVKPRLELAGADCERIIVIDESDKSLSMVDERLEEAIVRTGARLLILDPIQAYLGGGMDMNRANEARDMTKKLGALAEKTKCAIILIGHMNKASGNKAAYRGMGSIDFFAVARSVLLVGRVEGEPNTRAVVQIKNNLAAFGHPKAFALSEEGFQWIGDYEITVDEVLGYEEMKKLGDRWKTQPIGGEITWNWGSLYKFKSFEEVVADEKTRDLVIQQIRDLHCNHLGGITWANFNDPSFEPNAELLQKTMGYRFVLSNFSYPTSIKPDEPFKISFDVTNTGSSPFYYDWPVEISLLNSQTKEVVWSKTLKTPKISQWMPGDNWNNSTKVYTQPATPNHVEEELTLDKKLDTGDYIISIAVLDPAGMLPSLRFAVQNYFEGGRHPMGHIGVNTEPIYFEIPVSSFNDMRQDKTLKYKIQ